METELSQEEKKALLQIASPSQHFVEGEKNYEIVTEQIGSMVLNQKKHGIPWFVAFFIGFVLLNVLMASVGWLLYKGVGVWGINIPSAWGADIINFVWWIGIGHAGTLISAILLLARQQWRNSINRFAEAMTLFAVMCAGLYPLLHTGRPWVAYWLFPYPNILGAWPQFRSPLLWDVFAVSTYMTVSAMFWFVGLVPDLALLRDRTSNKVVRFILGIAALGWRGSAKHWYRYEISYLILAGLSAPLVLSVHTIVSFDFAVSQIPGWHTTIFPPYFVAGAVYAGFAMVLILMIPIRAWYNLKDLITMKHIDWMAKIMLTTGLIVFYGYIMENFIGLYSGNKYEMAIVYNRWCGPYRVAYWGLIFCNGLAPQILWFPKVRANVKWLWASSLVVSIGMWLERYVIIPVSLTRDFLPSSWGYYTPSFWDWAMFLGTIGLFTFLIFLFTRFLPIINIFEVKDLLHRERGHHAHDGDNEQPLEQAKVPVLAEK